MHKFGTGREYTLLTADHTYICNAKRTQQTRVVKAFDEVQLGIVPGNVWIMVLKSILSHL